mmetsp:Transcript_1851/g.5584  ORF Transcript_1851/g.5584 Transcript_1851/m.5584 type:complete len:229 (-) Transcript_1851:85-771(-)
MPASPAGCWAPEACACWSHRCRLSSRMSANSAGPAAGASCASAPPPGVSSELGAGPAAGKGSASGRTVPSGGPAVCGESACEVPASALMARRRASQPAWIASRSAGSAPRNSANASHSNVGKASTAASKSRSNAVWRFSRNVVESMLGTAFGGSAGRFNSRRLGWSRRCWKSEYRRSTTRASLGNCTKISYIVGSPNLQEIIVAPYCCSCPSLCIAAPVHCRFGTLQF